MIGSSLASAMILTSSLLLCGRVRSFGASKRACHGRIHIPNRMRAFTVSSALMSALSEQDEAYLAQALEHARNGFGRTFPNPAVGCVLVRQDTNEIIGSGFHPRAGFPHAEVFALLEATGYVPSGVEAAKAVVDGGEQLEFIRRLAKQYSSEGGPQDLFGDKFQSMPVTAYVTLEPCCHTGKTPPCASALALSRIDRVVVGFRDPNPRVDGGGVKLLEGAGVSVELAEGLVNQACADMVDSFVKRIVPKDYDPDYSWVNGGKRRALRRIAGKLKKEDGLTQHNWSGKFEASDELEVDELELDAMWMERLDFLLWQKELVNIRLNKAVGKKKLAHRLAERIARELGAHVAQTLGHTSLLYRPGVPPFLDLDDLVDSDQIENETVNGKDIDMSSGRTQEES